MICPTLFPLRNLGFEGPMALCDLVEARGWISKEDHIQDLPRATRARSKASARLSDEALQTHKEHAGGRGASSSRSHSNTRVWPMVLQSASSSTNSSTGQSSFGRLGSLSSSLFHGTR
jgi:hypothetical protein